jgi:hypothetical protein
MSEWLDFAIYAAQIVLFWVVLPRQTALYVAPMIADRDPEWPRRNALVVARIERSAWFPWSCYAWAVVSLAALLALRFGWRPAFVSASVPSWELLRDAYSLSMVLGFLGWLSWLAVWLRWLRRHVPLATRRSATLRPRSAAGYVGLPWRTAIEILTVINLAAWLVFGATLSDLRPDYWAQFGSVVALTVVFGGYALLVPRRRPGYPERLFGGAYRRVEVRSAYVLRLAPVIAGATRLGEHFGADVGRLGHLAIGVLVIGVVYAFARLRPLDTTAPPSSGGTRETSARVLDESFGSTIRGTIQGPPQAFGRYQGDPIHG